MGIFNFLGQWDQYLLPLVLMQDENKRMLSQGLGMLAIQQGYQNDSDPDRLHHLPAPSGIRSHCRSPQGIAPQAGGDRIEGTATGDELVAVFLYYSRLHTIFPDGGS